MERLLLRLLLLLALIFGNQSVNNAQNLCEINPDVAYLGSYFHTTVER